MTQKCWACYKCTNENMCEWVNGKLPNNVILKNGYIYECPNFVKDANSKNKKRDNGRLVHDFYKKVALQKFGFSERTYMLYKKNVIENKKVNSKLFKRFKEDYIKFLEQ